MYKQYEFVFVNNMLFFKTISDLFIAGEKFSLETENKGLIGLGKKKTTYQHSIFIERSSDPMAEMMLSDHYFDYILNLPGEIKKAYSLKMKNIEVEPSIEKNIVTWNIPLPLFFSNAGNTIIFRADFE